MPLTKGWSISTSEANAEHHGCEAAPLALALTAEPLGGGLIGLRSRVASAESSLKSQLMANLVT